MPSNEVGAALCRLPNGKLAFGPWAEGTPTSVNVSTRCPPGSRFEGIYHTHPAGVAIPSQTDLQSGSRVGARVLCVDADGDLRCYERVK